MKGRSVDIKKKNKIIYFFGNYLVELKKKEVVFNNP